MRMTPGHPSGPQDTPLFHLVFQRISESPEGSVPFSAWMDLALYHPEWGYYSRRGATPGFREVGRSGDFFTSVSVGETFGLLLAHRIARAWETDFGRTLPFVLVEQGGHDGRLARDILTGLREIGTQLLEGLEYRLVEPRPALREVLEAGLTSDPADRLRIVDSLEAARAPAGLFLCNELLDAFPVELLVFTEGMWHERRVGWDAATAGPAWVTGPLRPEWTAFAESLGTEFPEGYVTEICPAVDAWMKDAARLFDRGLWWIIDYGHERADYYLPQRSTGTLRCYRGHRAGENPFDHPGEQDLTAHVDFTRVEEAAGREGLARRLFTDQHHFLIDAGRPWLLSLEGKAPDPAAAKRLRQFQTLTHPSMMGQQFKVMELGRSGA
jgi:SAM-dependent MidA family methyltransferase